MNKKIAFIDMDGSIADYDSGVLEVMNKLQSPESPVITELFIDNETQHLEVQRHLISSQPGFWLNLEPIKEGIELVEFLELKGYRCIILTKGPRGKNFAWAEKKSWCDKYLPDRDVIVTTTKDVMKGDILYDDWPPYFEPWLQTNPNGLVIMRDTPSNRGYSNPQVIRYTGDNLYSEIYKKLRSR